MRGRGFWRSPPVHLDLLGQMHPPLSPSFSPFLIIVVACVLRVSWHDGTAGPAAQVDARSCTCVLNTCVSPSCSLLGRTSVEDARLLVHGETP